MIFVNDDNTKRIISGQLSAIEPAKYNEVYYIYFYSPAGAKLTWTFSDAEARDEALVEIEDYYGKVQC